MLHKNMLYKRQHIDLCKSAKNIFLDLSEKNITHFYLNFKDTNVLE